MADRRISWLSSLQQENDTDIDTIGHKLVEFYRVNENYYGDIDSSGDNWINPDEKAYQQILAVANASSHICEFGCGSANILRHFPSLSNRYSGCDFSDKLIQSNRVKYPEGNFQIIRDLNSLPFPDSSFDFVFSIFVIEHCNRPNLIFNECSRILRPGGKLMILCPDFLGRGRMSSQRAGFSSGTSKSKLLKGKFLDAVVTLFDNRVRIPYTMRGRRKMAEKSPQFYINVNPTVFADPFSPDVDAVYLTYKNEMISYLASIGLKALPNNSEIVDYEAVKQLIFLSMIK